MARRECRIDWTEEATGGVEAILIANNSEQKPIVRAPHILTRFGVAYYNWMDGNVKAGNGLDSLSEFTAGPIPDCDGFTINATTKDAILAFLNERYKTYTEASYRLWIVVNLLSKLTNIYPPATLHDCDDGSDVNPVQLGRTALGS